MNLNVFTSFCVYKILFHNIHKMKEIIQMEWKEKSTGHFVWKNPLIFSLVYSYECEN